MAVKNLDQHVNLLSGRERFFERAMTGPSSRDQTVQLGLHDLANKGLGA